MFTTGKCNLTCSYCGGSFESEVVPWTVKYDLEALKRTIERDNDATVIFYGGEPLSNPAFIMKAMDSIKATRWGIQTNGTLVRLLPERYWRRMNVALLSIDGRREITDKHRGRKVYDTVERNFRYIKSLGVPTIARMTVTEDTDIFEDVTHLLGLGFDKVHWQLNVVWTEKWRVREWAQASYLPGMRKLIDLFVDSLREGKVLGIVPILGVVSAHFHGGYLGSPCGAGYKSFSITTDGRVLSCPIAVREKWAELGTVQQFRILEDPLPEPCKQCEFRTYCGGRCFYASKEKYWGEEGFMEVDEITKEYLRIVLSRINEIEDLIRRGVVSLEQLRYDPTEDSSEVIP